MRRSMIVGLAGVGLIAVVVTLVLVSGDHEDDAPTPATGLPAGVTVEAGEVTVEIVPRQLDGQAARLKVVLDTHSVELSSDLAADARLEVAGTVWPVESWSGDGPGGHHREGELVFTPAGPARGTVRLVLDGFAEPVEVRWDLGA